MVSYSGRDLRFGWQYLALPFWVSSPIIRRLRIFGHIPQVGVYLLTGRSYIIYRVIVFRKAAAYCLFLSLTLRDQSIFECSFDNSLSAVVKIIQTIGSAEAIIGAVCNLSVYFFRGSLILIITWWTILLPIPNICYHFFSSGYQFEFDLVNLLQDFIYLFEGSSLHPICRWQPLLFWSSTHITTQ